MWMIYSFVLLSEFDIKQMQVREGRQRILAFTKIWNAAKDAITLSKN